MEEPQAAVTAAVELLAREVGCAPGEIEVVDVTPVTWPDSSLGCPVPGMMYLQVLTPGYRIRLLHGGQEYLMHTDRGKHAMRCADGGIIGDGEAPHDPAV